MSKTLFLKLKDDVFEETEDILDCIHKPRNEYINEAVISTTSLLEEKCSPID